MAQGQTDWRELLNYYREQQGRARKGSDLYNSITTNIENIEFLLEANGIPIPGIADSTISNPAEAGPARGLLLEGDRLTPEVEAILNDQVMYVTFTENAIYPANSNPLGSLVEQYLVDGTVKELYDGLVADAQMYEGVLDDILSGRSSLIRDPITGEMLELSDELIMDYAYQGLNNQYTLLAVSRALGSNVGAVERSEAARRGRLDTYVDKLSEVFVEHVFPGEADRNYNGVQGFVDSIFHTFNLDRNTALDSYNPYDAQLIFRSAGSNLNKNMAALDRVLASLPAGVEIDENMTEQIEYAKKLATFMVTATAPGVDPNSLLETADQLLNERPDSFYLTPEDIAATIGRWDDPVGNQTPTTPDRLSPGWHGLLGALGASEGLSTTQMIREQGVAPDPNAVGGPPQYVWVARYGESEAVPVRSDQVSNWLGVDAKYTDEAFPFVEKVTQPDGTTKTVTVWRQMLPVSEAQNTEWWVKLNSNGQPVQVAGDYVWATREEYESFGEDLEAARQAGFAPMEMPILAGMRQVIGPDGNIYYTTENQTGLHSTMPIDGALRGETPPYALLNEDGIMPRSYQSRNGLPMGMGPNVSMQEAQDHVEAAMIANELPAGYMNMYDSSGIVTGVTEFEDVIGAFWTPAAQGQRHSEIRLRYQEQARSSNKYRQMQRERAWQEERRQAEESQMQAQAAAEGGSGMGASLLQDNAIQQAMRSSGIRFSARENETRRPSLQPQERPAPTRPVTIDDIKKPEVPDYRTTGTSGGARPI